METLEDTLEMLIEAGKSTPNISFKNGVLNIKGRSLPHESGNFFDSLLKLFYLYSLNPRNHTTININLDYINSTTNRSLMSIMIIAEKIKRNGYAIEINWYTSGSDDPTNDYGVIIQSLIDIPFHFISK